MDIVRMFLLLFIVIETTTGVPVMSSRNSFKISSLPQKRSSFEEDYSLDELLLKSENTLSSSYGEEIKNNERDLIPEHRGYFGKDYNPEEIRKAVESWDPEDDNNVWEFSGLFEGDIMLNSDVEKNGLLNTSMRWPYGVVPYKLNDDFDTDEKEIIEKALAELSNKTCIIFRPYNKKDVDYVTVQGTESGCWSYVGRLGKGQTLNLQTPACVRHATVIHEFLHALGFYHQQSSPDRDEYVIIHWENIIESHKHNFKKYNNDTVTNYNIEYDYGSVMHYGPAAFAKNKTLHTITPKAANVTIGQRIGLSKKDEIKLKIMYADECAARDTKKVIKGKSSESSSILSSWELY